MVTIDADLLQSRSILDAGVLIRAFGDRPADPAAPVCKAFVQAMIDHKKAVLIGATTLAELARGGGAPVPRQRGIEVVSFDQECARFLGERLPMSVLHEVKNALGLSMTYLKFDALLVALAIRHRADVIVTLDADVHALAKQVSVRCASPRDFLHAQTSIQGI